MNYLSDFMLICSLFKLFYSSFYFLLVFSLTLSEVIVWRIRVKIIRTVRFWVLAGQLPRGMYTRLMFSINGVCVKCWESSGTTICGMMMWGGKQSTTTGYCSIVPSLPVCLHCMNARRIRCRADLNSFPLGELEETTGTPLYYVDEDYPAGPGIIEPLPERSNWRGSESSTLENDVYIWSYTLI